MTTVGAAELMDLWRDVRSELQRAMELFPPFHSAHEGWAVIKEEMDELWEIVRFRQDAPARNKLLREEAIQVAAMALRFLIDMDGFKN